MGARVLENYQRKRDLLAVPKGVAEIRRTRASLATRIRILYAERQGSNAIVPGCAASAPAELLFRPSPFAVLSVNIGHNMEHYGNLVTYTRMKGIVPPRSEQQGAMPAQKQDPSDKK